MLAPWSRGLVNLGSLSDVRRLVRHQAADEMHVTRQSIKLGDGDGGGLPVAARCSERCGELWATIKSISAHVVIGLAVVAAALLGDSPYPRYFFLIKERYGALARNPLCWNAPGRNPNALPTASDTGNARAQPDLGMMYPTGEGVGCSLAATMRRVSIASAVKT